MKNQLILSDYLENAMEYAEFEKLEDSSYFGKISNCDGVVTFGKTLSETNNALRSTLEDWVLLGLKMGHTLPIINGINFNINSLEY